MLLASTALSALPAMAQDVGTAAAVNPLSKSTPPGGTTRVLRIGARVVHKERVQTTAEGTVQLLFIDKTTLNIGPNSNLVIDNFVYDPSAGTGKIAASLTKGALRFVGGQLSHQGAATVSTPVATIGIRGGIATISHGPEGTRIINDFGWLSITNGCGTTFIRRTGFAVSVADWNSCPTEPQRVTQSETNHYLELLTSKTGQNGGAPSLPTDVLVGQFGIGQFNGTFGPNSQPIQQQTTNVENVTANIIIQATQKAAAPVLRVTIHSPPPPPTPSPPPPPPPPPPPLRRAIVPRDSQALTPDNLPATLGAVSFEAWRQLWIRFASISRYTLRRRNSGQAFHSENQKPVQTNQPVPPSRMQRYASRRWGCGSVV